MKSEVRFDTFYTYKMIEDAAELLAKDHPDFVRVHRIGRTHQERDVILLRRRLPRHTYHSGISGTHTMAATLWHFSHRLELGTSQAAFSTSTGVIIVLRFERAQIELGV